MHFPIVYDQLTVDTVQTAGIFFIIMLIIVLWRRRDEQLAREHRDLQDAILSQYTILHELAEQREQLAQLDKIVEQNSQRLTKIDHRHHAIDGHRRDGYLPRLP